MSKDKYEHLVGRRCVLQVEGGKKAEGVVSDVSRDGVLFVHDDGSGVPLIPHDKIGHLVLQSTAERDERDGEEAGIGARTRQPGDQDAEATAPDERPRSLPGLQQREQPRQPQTPPTGSPVASPASGPPERQPREGGPGRGVPVTTPVPETPNRPPREGEIPARPPNAEPGGPGRGAPVSVPTGTPDRPPLREGEVPARPPTPATLEKDVDPRQQRERR